MEPLEPQKCRVGVEEALSIITGKWKPIILLHLQINGTKRFSDLKKLIPGITQKMLTAQLKELEEQKLISRVVYPEVPPRVEYSITEHGESIRQMLQQIHDWGISHMDFLHRQP